VSPAAVVRELDSLDQVAALAHPLRRRILAALADPASPADVARKLGLPPQLANYHVRALAAAGLAEQVEVRQRRNLLERRFRAVARTFSLAASLPLSDQQRELLQQDVALQELVQTADGMRRAALGLLDQAEHAERHLAAITLDVELGDQADRAAFVRAVVEAVQHAAEPYRASTADRARRTESTDDAEEVRTAEPTGTADQARDGEATGAAEPDGARDLEAVRRAGATRTTAFRVQLAVYPRPDPE
jgi:DNA-binding transcriptional ArsR family regulator